MGNWLKVYAKELRRRSKIFQHESELTIGKDVLQFQQIRACDKDIIDIDNHEEYSLIAFVNEYRWV